MRLAGHAAGEQATGASVQPTQAPGTRTPGTRAPGPQIRGALARGMRVGGGRGRAGGGRGPGGRGPRLPVLGAATALLALAAGWPAASPASTTPAVNVAMSVPAQPGLPGTLIPVGQNAPPLARLRT